MQSSFVIALLSLALASQAAGPKVSKQQGDTFMRKVAVIAAHDGKHKAQTRTPVNEAEVNSWFAYQAQPLLPKGVADPAVSILGQGRVSGRAVVDLDAVAKKKSTGATLDPWSYIGGRVPVTVTGVLHTKDGKGRFELQSAQVSSIPVPKTLLQEMISYYSRSPNHPEGLSLDEPFTLPANIRQIEVGQGQAVIVQ